MRYGLADNVLYLRAANVRQIECCNFRGPISFLKYSFYFVNNYTSSVNNPPKF
jgi:hypothetical protein